MASTQQIGSLNIEVQTEEEPNGNSLAYLYYRRNIEEAENSKCDV